MNLQNCWLIIGQTFTGVSPFNVKNCHFYCLLIFKQSILGIWTVGQTNKQFEDTTLDSTFFKYNFINLMILWKIKN